jgi:hypothetical protein
METIYELKEVLKPTKIINFMGDTINVNNLISKTITTRLFWKTSLILRMKTGEYITYDWVNQADIDRLFKA